LTITPNALKCLTELAEFWDVEPERALDVAIQSAWLRVKARRELADGKPDS
jgi:hypothetical protein